ncbi:hypothetical protein EUTSA_v10029151mg [Eutrema salsugineum]|uniref:KIB1-4 beta-propeller domain-containing protein n=1 Tax=Eutrema salsugineum TaxID=72664 RepID=V4MZW2_EUTSA|nr:hypothetical protein EUTSA_v10029151mg [Eutrema salsugineum]
MYLPKRGNLFELYDPLQQKMYTLDLPELAKSTVCYSRDAWLLMRKTTSRHIFFNPFTLKLINLPKLELSYDAIAFSCAPTSGTCVLLAFLSTITTSTCRPEATEWVTEYLHFYLSFDSLKNNNVVYANRRFYCLDNTGSLYFFEPSSLEWSFSRFSYQYERKKKRFYLTVRKGVFFKMFTCGGEKPIVLYSSEMRVNLPWMRNSVYFPRLCFNCKRCVSYLFDEERYYPRKQWQEQEDLCLL